MKKTRREVKKTPRNGDTATRRAKNTQNRPLPASPRLRVSASSPSPSLRERLAEAEARLAEAEETLRAIRSGEVDALVVGGPQGDRVFTLQGAETTYRLLVEEMNEGALLLGPEGRILYANARFAQLAGAPLEQVTGSPWERFFVPAEQARLKQLLPVAKTACIRQEFHLQLKGEAPRPVELSVCPMDREPIKGFSVVLADLTERKAAEAALRASNEQLESRVQERTLELRQSEERVRRKLQSVLLPEGDFGLLELADLLDTAALQKLLDDFYAVARIPLAILDAKGRVLVGVGWQEICTRFHRANPESSRHCLESDLQLSAGLKPGESRLYKCKNNMWDMATPIIIAGQHLGNVFTGQFFFEGEAPDRSLFRAQARRYGFDEVEYLAALDRVPRFTRETINRGMGFLVKLSDMVSQLGYSNIKLARLVTERERLAESLRQQQFLIQAVIENCADPIFLKDRDSRFLLANPATCAVIGKPAARIIGKTDLETYDDPAIGRQMMENDRRVIESGQSQVLEEIVSHPDGPRTFLSAKTPYRDAHGRVIGVIGIARDITERKRAERDLAEQARLLDLSNDAIIVRDGGDRVTYWNEGAEELYGYTRREALGKMTHELLGTEFPESLERISERLRREKRWEGELSHRRKDGSRVTTLSRWAADLDGAGRVVSVLETNNNISGLKEAEAALRGSLREKEVMLKEIHHRVKNNLQVIASLVDMQTSALNDPAQGALFQDVRDRVRTMAMVHEKLYQSESLARLDLAGYTESLVGYLARAHEKPETRVELKLDLEPVWLSIVKAVPFGLILNELVTNAFKHAFRGRPTGEITTALRAGPDGQVCLRVSDNGVGLPAGMDWRQAPSLGMQLIDLLTGQLRATVEVRCEGGTEFEISFKPERSDERK